jgi:hypothetical protein
MVDIVVARGAGILQLFDMETVRNRDIVRVEMGGSLLDIKDSLMATDAIWIDLIKFGGKTCMFPFAGEGKDIDARHQGMAGGMTLRAVDFGMQGRLFPERGFPLLMMAGDTEFLFGSGVGGQGNSGINGQYRQNSP